MGRRVLVPVGSRFGRLVTCGEREGRDGKLVQVCCDCGTCKRANIWDLRAGRVTSCGCGVRHDAEVRAAVAAVSVTQAAWLAGLWDGEGCVMIRGRTDHSERLSAEVIIGMTDVKTGAVVRDLLRSAGVTFGRSAATLTSSRHKALWRVSVRNYLGIAQLAAIVTPYAVTKRRHWELVGEFAERRLERAHGSPMTDRDYEIASMVKESNRRGP